MSRSYQRSRLLVPLACGLLLVCCPWIPVTAAVTLEQVQLDRQQQLRHALEQGSLEGQFVEQTPGNYVFAPARGDLPGFRVANPQAVGLLASGPQVNLRGVVQEDGRVKVSGYSLTTSNTASFQSPQATGATKLLRASLEAAIKPGAMDAKHRPRNFGGMSQIEIDTRKGIAQVVSKYAELVKDEGSPAEKVNGLVREWLVLRQDLARTYTESEEGKAIYDQPDNYAPWRYDRIFRQSPAVVAIAAPGADRPSCSGVLIASDLVLTAGHCFSAPYAVPPKEMEAWFGYFTESGDAMPADVEKIPIAGMVAPRAARLGDILNGGFGPDLLDYVVLSLSKTPGKDKPIAPQCVRKAPLYKGDAVYVMGFPQGGHMTVHDSARVYLPFRILDENPFYKLRLDIHADLMRLPSYDQRERDQFMKEFDASYVPKKEEGFSWRVLHHVEDGGEPRMGIVSDTFRGNSGGPVYERERSQCVVGILIAGSPDTGVRRTANWREHERVLPLSSVIEDLEKDEQTRGLVPKIRME
jgi:hypothetical protein